MSKTLSGAPHNAALITGASAGIGRELARLLAQDGYPVVLVARDRAALETLASELSSRHRVATHVIVQDLSVPHAARQIVDALSAAQLDVEVLVNNAGFGIQGKFADGDESAELALLQVNIVALTQLSRLLLPGMLKRGAGRILNVASTAAFQPGPYMALYYASKAFVLSLSQALHYELRNSAVSVTALCPGATRTEFASRASMGESRLFQGPTMAAADVARSGYAAMLRGRRVVIPGLRNRLMAKFVRISPPALVLRVAARMNRKH